MLNLFGLMCTTDVSNIYEGPTYRTRSTKVKSDQVNYRHYSKVSGEQEPNSTYNFGAK